MTAAADKLKTWTPGKAAASDKWRTEFDKLLKNKTAADVWKTKIATAKRELSAESDQSDKDIAEYGKLLKDFHEDVGGRMKNAMTMIDALGKGEPFNQNLADQAKKYLRELILDLSDPVDQIFKKSADAMQANRLNLTSDDEIDRSSKAGNGVPADAMKALLAEYKKRRKAVIDESNSITATHKDKIKTYVPRAMDALAMVSKLESLPTTNRDDAKSDLKGKIEEAAAFFTEAQDGNFLQPASRIVDMQELASAIGATSDAKKINAMLMEAGGKERVAAYVALIAKNYNQWKIQEKKIDLLGVQCNRLANDTLAKEMKKVQALSDKNKAEGQRFKGSLEKIAEGWKATAGLRKD
jgi:hypothetical protein